MQKNLDVKNNLFKTLISNLKYIERKYEKSTVLYPMMDRGIFTDFEILIETAILDEEGTEIPDHYTPPEPDKDKRFKALISNLEHIERKFKNSTVLYPMMDQVIYGDFETEIQGTIEDAEEEGQIVQDSLTHE